MRIVCIDVFGDEWGDHVAPYRDLSYDHGSHLAHVVDHDGVIVDVEIVGHIDVDRKP